MIRNEQETHVCRECYEVDKGFTYLTNDQKRCIECGGVVLSLQETADYICELKEEIRALKEIYENSY